MRSTHCHNSLLKFQNCDDDDGMVGIVVVGGRRDASEVVTILYLHKEVGVGLGTIGTICHTSQ